MIISIRLAKKEDNTFYKRCFENKELVYMLCSDEPLDIDFYLQNTEDKIRLICSIANDNGESTDIGFAQFIDNGGMCFTIIGGLLPNYFNSGLGIYIAVAAISCFFAKYPNHVLLGGVFLHNKRSARMQYALGFKKIREQCQRSIFRLTSSDFNNIFVNRIKDKMDVITNLWATENVRVKI